MKKIYIFLFCLVSLMIQAQIYDYPMRPGVKGWGDLVTEDDRFAALQIPEETLKSMNTHDLIITCLNLPVMSHYVVFSTLQQGMDVLIQNFNGLQELMKRDDAPMELLALYKKMDTKTMKLSEEGVNQSYWSLRRGFFEMLLVQEPILEKMNETTRLALIKEAQKRIYQKIDDEKEYSSFSYRPTLLILKKSLNKVSDSNLDELKKIKSDPIVQFLEQDTLHVGLMSASPVYSNVYISTPNGTSVPALKLISGDMSQGE